MICGDCPEYNRSYGVCKKTGWQKAIWSQCDPQLKDMVKKPLKK